MEPQSPPQDGGSAPERPTLGPTRPATLLVAGLAAAAVSWLLISRFYGNIPALPLLPTITLAALAVLEGYVAINTRARIDRKPGREPVDPLAVARYAVLAKASSLAGAIFAGMYAGILGWLLIERTRASSNDIPAATAGLVASLALVAAALWLERSCRVPEQPDSEKESDKPDK
ncbi:DUF3180 domain-containing protein [Micromonospora sp. CPCC 206061]|uniref:DUF3180 domain-containing protein n=1 Tax=Micromonospora sp. CPCC 206061 TaxID=3122410 RepID=UPI002FF01800